MDKIKSLFIVGPTASGKTKLSVELAKAFDGEIVSADSMQIYRKMNIGTAKPTEEEKAGIPHYMLDICDISEKYSVAKYASDAKIVIKDIHSRHKLPIVVGGTGLYVDAIINDTHFAEYEENPAIRESLKNELEEYGAQYMYDKLMSIDGEAADKLHVNDTKRVMRAIETYMLTGITKSELDRRSHESTGFCEPVIIGLNFSDREKLYERINDRVDKLIEIGLADEVKNLIDLGLDKVGTAFQAIGYKEIAEYVYGRCSLEEAVDVLKMETRRYAKRQLTWFRRNKDINWIYVDTDAQNSFDKVLSIASQIVKEKI